MRNWLNSGISARRNRVICVPEIMPLVLQEGRLWWSPSLLAGLSKLDVGSSPTRGIFQTATPNISLPPWRR